MTYHWTIVPALGVTTLTLRVVVPLAAGGRERPGRLRTALPCAAPVLIAGLAVALLAAKRSILTAMAGAAVVTALLRPAFGWSPRSAVGSVRVIRSSGSAD